MKPWRVCQLITELGPGGAERMVYELARRLDPQEFAVEVAALRGGVVADWLRNRGIVVHILGVRGKWDLLKLARLAGLLREGRFDLLHTHLFHADLAGRPAASLAGVPHLVNTVHVAEGRCRPWQFAYARLMGEQCDRIVCVSEAVKAFHAARTHLPEWRYAVIPNGIDVDAYGHDPQARRRLRGQWGLDEQAFVLAFVGRLDVQKGIDTLLGALSHLGARGRPAEIVVAGEGPQRSVLENYVSHGEGGRHCRILGHVDDVRSVLSAADCLVQPSRYEGLSLATAEAMAAGLPVAATRVAGIEEVVEHGSTGLLVPAGEAVALAEAVERLRQDRSLARRLGQAGLARARQRYAIEANVCAHARLYRDILSGGGSPEDLMDNAPDGR